MEIQRPTPSIQSHPDNRADVAGSTHSSTGTGLILAGLLVGLLVAVPAASQQPLAGDGLSAETLSGLSLRHLGPGLMSGRIADIAIHPNDRHLWYVAVGSGGVWKTTNAGTTWTPIFDDQTSYSIGAVTLDPSDPDVVWVGTGENVSGRHVGYGDGVYRSLDGGASWKKMGLEASEHISKIIVDPRDSNVVYVAAEGPLWSSGGDRGVFKSSDGGETWAPSLSVSEETGFASLVIDPANPDVLYAAAYQRRRTVWALLAGGPESGIWKTEDAGATWRQVENGLPKSDKGKIGLAVSPLDSQFVYATIEADPDDAGFYRSTDGGESWEKRNGYLSGGTGPHYYQEIYASPHDLDTVYQMDVFIQWTEDGGKTFSSLGEPDKHSDNHAMAFVAGDPDYLLAGCDGGLYQSFDHGKSWRFTTNLPVTQLYKLAVDNDSPSYNMIGGTQDNGTIVGPARTFNRHGVRSQDWYVAYGADGYAAAVDPEDANILYVSWQTGHPLRFDRKTGELVEIQPQPEPGDPPERYNWDAPILISPHAPERLYYGSYRLWRSDDRGDSWRAISGDLTQGLERYELPVAGRVRSADALWGNSAMSWYSTLTAIDESPLVEGLLYTGSDDGVIQVSEDGGQSWRRSRLAGVPEKVFVNELKASMHDPDTAFAAVDNHKQGDYAPYLLKSTDRGKSWRSISGDLPDRHLVWSIVQDHIREELLFAGTEFGIFTSLDGGKKWIEMEGGAPTIAFRDLEIQRRESDLVAASFGRGFYVLDDYSPLREVSAEAMARDAVLFPVRETPWFVPAQLLQSRGRDSQGADYWSAANPPDGALVTYHLKESLVAASERRKEGEKKLSEDGKDVPFPGFDALREEERKPAPKILLTIRDSEGAVVRRMEGPMTKGIHRVSWDLRYPALDPIRLETPTDLPPWFEPPRGPMAPPGRYSIELARIEDGEVQSLGERQTFEVTAILEPSLEGASFTESLEFQRRTGELYRQSTSLSGTLREARSRLDHVERAVLETPAADVAWLAEVKRLRRGLAAQGDRLFGDATRQRFEEPTVPSVIGRLSTVIEGHWGSRHGPTATHRKSVEVAAVELAEVSAEIAQLVAALEELENQLEQAGAPFTPGRRPAAG